MEKGKILCIDDNPEEIIESSDMALDKTLKDIFKGSRYKIIFAPDGKAGLAAVNKDKSIKLVLLDIKFPESQTEPGMQGPEIADKLNIIDPQVKIIVLTNLNDTGKKRSFGWKPNVVGYVIKREISDKSNSLLIKNLAEGVIEDPLNKRWILSLDTDKRKAKLSKDEFTMSFSIPRSERQWLLLEACANNPNKPVASFDIEGYTQLEAQYNEYVNREVYNINKRVMEKTQWRTWGILDTRSDEQSSAKLVIGDVKIDNEEITNYKRHKKDKYVTHEEFMKFIEGFEKFKKEVFIKLEDFNKNKSS